MKKILKTTIPFLASLFIAFSANAEERAIGKGDYHYKERTFSSSPTEEECRLALDLAKSNAILAYASTLNDATRTLFERDRNRFLANPDKYIISYREIGDPENDKKANIYSIAIEAYVDDVKIKKDLGARHTSKDATMAKNNIAVFFIAREVESATSFKHKKTNVNENTREIEASQSQSSTGSDIDYSESASELSISSAGGSTAIRSDNLEYRVDPVSRDEFGAALMDIFSSRGMDNIYDGAFFESINYMESDYGTGSSIKPSTWKKIRSELKDPEYDVSYVVVGTIDLGQKEINNNTGLIEVQATLSAKIYNIQGAMPKLVSSLRPISLKGRGTTQDIAKKQALVINSKDAAEEIIDKLREKDLL